MSAMPEPAKNPEKSPPPKPQAVPSSTRSEGSAARAKLQAENLNFFYSNFQALHNISIAIPEKKITALIGPSGCGKSTFLRTLNRINETIKTARYEGTVSLDGQDVRELDVTNLRRRVGMVFQRPNPFPKSIFDNIAFGLRVNGLAGRRSIADVVEASLKRAALWDEVKDKLHQSAYSLSGGQQQRLCIARALAVDPEVLLLDEPCSALDPISTAKIEELLFAIKDNCTLVIVTHNMQQAARASDFTAFMLEGKLVEYQGTEKLFTTPSDPRTEAYITGRFG